MESPSKGKRRRIRSSQEATQQTRKKNEAPIAALPKVSGSHFPLTIVQTVINGVIAAGCGLRSVSRIFGIFSRHIMPWLCNASTAAASIFRRIPSYNSAKNWLLKLGLHKLNRAKEEADDWVFLIDKTI